MFQTTIVITGNTKKNNPETHGQKKNVLYITKRCLILRERTEKLSQKKSTKEEV